MSNFLLFLPETTTLLAALAVFVCVAVRVARETTWMIALIGGFAMIAVCGATIAARAEGSPFAPGVYRVDFFSQIFKLVFAAGYVLVLIAGRKPRTIRPSAWQEFPLLLLFSTAGMMMLVSSTELITLYLALELSAFPLYVLVAIHRDHYSSSEGAAKYMLQGMVASAVTLYGMSFLFGMTQSTYLDIIAVKAQSLGQEPLFWMGVLLTLAGFLYKLALFPFHFWTPDTYQSGPHPAVTFIATASKVATVAVLCRIVALLRPADPESVAEGLRFALLCFSVAAMTIGNLAAIVQHDLKRLLGYSAMAHAGYLIVGLQSFTDLGLTATLFYSVGYFAMSYLCFLVVCEVGRDDNMVGIDAVAGLWHRSPFLALCLLVGLFGLSGLPPTVGFIGKWFLFSAAMERGDFMLVLIAAINSVIAVYYYLRIIRMAYLVAPERGKMSPPALTIMAGTSMMILVLWMGTAPGFFWGVVRAAVAPLGLQ